MYYKVKDETISDIAKAIRTKNGVTGEIKVEDFAQSILELNIGENTEAASQSASEAAASAISAQSSALAAAESASKAASNFETSEQSANEAKASAEESEAKAQESMTSAENSKLSSFDAEAWAVGTRDGIDVTSEDVAYQNNAKYWCEKTKEMVTFEEMTVDEFQNIYNEIFQQEVLE